MAVSAVPYFFNLDLTRACIESKTHMVDMGGNTDIVFQQRELSDKARSAGVTVLPDCGVAPGMANILAVDGINRLERADSVKIRVGGLPQEPKGALNYQLFSWELCWQTRAALKADGRRISPADLVGSPRRGR